MSWFQWGHEGDLFSQLDTMQRQMDRMVSTFSRSPGTAGRQAFRSQVYPALNVYKNGEGYVVRAELPGIESKSLDIEVTGDTLTLRGERKAPELTDGASYHRRERDFGTFRRSLSLPEKVDGSKTAASYNDGVLEVRLPFAEETKARKIAISA